MSMVSLLVFTESHDREDAFRSRIKFLQEELIVLHNELQGLVEVFTPNPGLIRDKRDLRQAVCEIQKQVDIGCCILYIGTFVNASDVAMAVRLINLPCILLGNKNTNTVSCVGFLAAAGAITQAGLSVKRIDGDIRDQAIQKQISSFCAAANAKKLLSGETFGMIGGRALGISTGTADSAQWMKEFGIDITHIDQLEIVTRAKNATQDKIKQFRNWIFQRYGQVNFQANRFEEDHLEKMIRSYLAVQSMIKDYGLDFAGIKCQPEMSNGFVLQCLTIQLLNDKYDAEGPKKPFVCSCEADADGALTMEIMKHISGNKPTSLQDVFCFEEKRIMVLANCGAGASYFAGYSSNEEENLKQVFLQPHGFGTAGGASCQFNYAPGINTLARLTRKNMKYRMLITRGLVQKRCKKDLEKYSWYRPTSVMEMEIDNETLSHKLESNHLLTLEGDYVKELEEFCILNSIEFDTLIDN